MTFSFIPCSDKNWWTDFLNVKIKLKLFFPNEQLQNMARYDFFDVRSIERCVLFNLPVSFPSHLAPFCLWFVFHCLDQWSISFDSPCLLYRYIKRNFFSAVIIHCQIMKLNTWSMWSDAKKIKGFRKYKSRTTPKRIVWYFRFVDFLFSWLKILFIKYGTEQSAKSAKSNGFNAERFVFASISWMNDLFEISFRTVRSSRNY